MVLQQMADDGVDANEYTFTALLKLYAYVFFLKGSGRKRS